MRQARRFFSHETGFTLIETLIAVLVTGLAIALFTAALNTFALTKVSAHNYVALRIAENELEKLRAQGYGALPASGSFSDSLLSSLPSGAGALAVDPYNSKTKTVSASVSWLELSGTSTVTLTTLITQTGGL